MTTALSSAAGRDDKNEMLEVFRPQRSLDLGPPVLAALKRNEILPNGEILLLKLRPELTRKIAAVFARVGDEGPALSSGAHENVRLPASVILRTFHAAATARLQ